MKRITSIAAVALALTACGGGGGGGGTSGASTPVGAAPATQLASYIGNWASVCSDHAIDSATISRTPGTTDSITIAIKTDYHSNANCSGAILGTWSESANATAVYNGTADATVVLTLGAAATTIHVDKVTASMGQATATVIGTGVVRKTTNGQPQWCIDYGNGSSICIKDEGTYPASTQPGGLYLQGNILYELVVNGSTYSVNEAFTRQ
jgi:hypothetical protein